MKISIVIPVLNEATLLRDTVSRLRASMPPDGEVIVVDGGSRDGTAELAATLADKAIVASRSGRARQMHDGALAASGDLLLFLHADTFLPQGWSGLLFEAWLKKPLPTFTAFRLSFDKTSRVYRLIEWLSECRRRFTGVPQGDQAIAVRREHYFLVGGFPDVPLMEEYFLARQLLRRGPPRMIQTPVKTSSRRYEKNGPMLNALRNSFLVFLFYLKVPVRLLARLYR